MEVRDTHKYDFKIGNKIMHSGVANGIDRHEGEHQRRWPRGHIVQVGNRTTREAATEWEESNTR